MTQKLRGNILSDGQWVRGEVAFDERILDISGVSEDPQDNNEDYILPGFIDLHVHGGGGRDLMGGGDAHVTITRQHARYGTTSLLGTTMTAPDAEIVPALDALGKACTRRTPQAARILGVHLEGPYINPQKLGAQPHFARVADMSEILRYAALVPIRVLTLAPELAGHHEIIRELTKMGVRVQLGHSVATYEESVVALEQGASSFTHLFNAMEGLHHRAPGAVGAAFAHARYAELIPDLIHVHPGAIRAALRAIPRLYCVTDSTAAAGMPDGPYMLGSMHVHKCLGGVRLADGTLAGSCLTMDQALRNLVSLGLSVTQASDRVSSCPAEYLGLTDRGALRVQSFADLVVLDRQLQLKAVYVEGERIDLEV